ncbi:FecR family protein, partial [Bordetella petrii]|uniref:FecR family protein n=1 Tax=Bordetella petrii TaxID=94624 RepID=UPI001E38E6E6
WAGWAGWRHTPLPALAAGWQADHRAGVGETRRVQLPDGTQVWLRALSAFNVDYSASLRRLQLVDGEILIDTGSDPARPFVVATGQGRLQALGTRFSVRQESDGVLLAVYGGAVRVVTARRQVSGVVPAGQQAYFTADALRPMTPASPAREAWARGILVADGIPLGQVVEELRRYHAGHLGVDPEVAGLRVFGSYPLNDLPHALDMLASVLPVRVRRPMSWWLSIEARR